MTRVLAIAGLLCLSLFAGDGGAAYAQQGRVIQTLPKQLKTPKRTNRPVVEHPTWDTKPSWEEIAEYYPVAAGSTGLDGRATISCAVRASGILSNCSLVSESPQGHGFGEAAIKMSSRFKMKPMMVDGIPVEGGSVRIPIAFNAPEPEPQSLKTVEPTASPTLTSEQYAKALGQAATCEQFLNVAASAEDVRPLIAAATLVKKSEFETSGEFYARYGRGIGDSIGGAKFLTIRQKLSGRELSYDADRGLFGVSTYALSTKIGCDSNCSFRWELDKYYALPSLEFSVPRDVAAMVKTGSTLVIGYPVEKIRGSQEGGQLTMITSARCAVLVSSTGVYAANSPLWFDRSAGRKR